MTYNVFSGMLNPTQSITGSDKNGHSQGYDHFSAVRAVQLVLCEHFQVLSRVHSLTSLDVESSLFQERSSRRSVSSSVYLHQTSGSCTSALDVSPVGSHQLLQDDFVSINHANVDELFKRSTCKSIIDL